MRKWFYTRTNLFDEDAMDAMGAKGWELVSVVQPLKGLHPHDTAPPAIMFWKRPIEQ